MSQQEHQNMAEQIGLLMRAHAARSRSELCMKLGVSKNAVRNWELAGEIPEQYLQSVKRPVQLIAALAVLRDGQLTDFDARMAARIFLEQLEVGHA